MGEASPARAATRYPLRLFVFVWLFAGFAGYSTLSGESRFFVTVGAAALVDIWAGLWVRGEFRRRWKAVQWILRGVMAAAVAVLVDRLAFGTSAWAAVARIVPLLVLLLLFILCVCVAKLSLRRLWPQFESHARGGDALFLMTAAIGFCFFFLYAAGVPHVLVRVVPTPLLLTVASAAPSSLLIDEIHDRGLSVSDRQELARRLLADRRENGGGWATADYFEAMAADPDVPRSYVEAYVLTSAKLKIQAPKRVRMNESFRVTVTASQNAPLGPRGQAIMVFGEPRFSDAPPSFAAGMSAICLPSDLADRSTRHPRSVELRRSTLGRAIVQCDVWIASVGRPENARVAWGADGHPQFSVTPEWVTKTTLAAEIEVTE